MSLNKNFQGNMVDKDSASVAQVRGKGYHKQSNTWSDWYEFNDETQYNINLGDSQFLGQDSSVNPGDDILIILETKETDPLDRQFCMYEVELDGSDTYVQDLQLMDCQAPNVVGLWGLSSTVDGTTKFTNADDSDVLTSIGRINDTISTSTNFNDSYTWTYDGATLKHVESWYSQDIFGDRLSVDSIEFDWTEDDTFITDTTYSFTAISTGADKSQEVEVKAINQKGQVVTSILKIQIRYNTPIVDIVWDPNSPNVLDTFTVTGANTDVDGVVTAISYQYDEVEVANNTTLDYNWTQDLGDTYVPTHTVNSDVSWNDGFNDHVIIHQETFGMTNIGPDFTLEKEVIGEAEDNDVKFTPTNLVDPDGDDTLLEIRWMIEYLTPFDNTYKVVHNPGYPGTASLDPKEWIFTVAGEYRITAIAKDEFGLETSREQIVDFESSSECTGSGSIKLNNGNWQLISVPVDGKSINEYFLNKVEAIMQTYDGAYTAADAIEVCNAYPGQINKFLSFVPGVTSPSSEHNFSLIMNDGTSINEITAFWVKMNDYYALTNDEDIIINWNQQD